MLKTAPWLREAEFGGHFRYLDDAGIYIYIRTYILVYRHDHTVPYISMVGFLHMDLSSLSTEAWHLSQLMLLFMTQAAMELDSRGLLALLLLSLLLGSKQRW